MGTFLIKGFLPLGCGGETWPWSVLYVSCFPFLKQLLAAFPFSARWFWFLVLPKLLTYLNVLLIRELLSCPPPPEPRSKNRVINARLGWQSSLVPSSTWFRVSLMSARYLVSIFFLSLAVWTTWSQKAIWGASPSFFCAVLQHFRCLKNKVLD